MLDHSRLDVFSVLKSAAGTRCSVSGAIRLPKQWIPAAIAIRSPAS